MRASGKTTAVDHSEFFYASTARPSVDDSRLCAVGGHTLGGRGGVTSTTDMRTHDIRVVSAYTDIYNPSHDTRPRRASA